MSDAHERPSNLARARDALDALAANPSWVIFAARTDGPCALFDSPRWVVHDTNLQETSHYGDRIGVAEQGDNTPEAAIEAALKWGLDTGG